MGGKEKSADIVKRLETAVKDTSLEKIYFNGFAAGIGTGDIMITLERNGIPITVLNTSYTVAKSLAEKMTEIIEKLEKQTGNTIMTTDVIHSKVFGIKKEK
jgi:hypothetical protein